MADIFISYASEDRDRAKFFAKSLEDQGWSVWWDRDLPFGRPFDEVIRTELRAAECVVALWTESAAKSLYVIGEARDALSLNKLISVFLSQADIPYDLRAIHGVELIDWHRDTSNADYQRLVCGITAIVGLSPQKAKVEIEHKAEEKEKRRQGEEKTKRKDSEETERKAEKELERKEAEVEGELKEKPKHDAVVQHAKEEATVKPVEEKTSITSPKPTRRKGIALGIGAIILSTVLIGIFFYRYWATPHKTFQNSIGMKFILIPAGKFTMGSDIGIGYITEVPSHSVNISRPFYLQKTEVTQGQWKAVMGDNPSEFKECGEDCPVERVSFSRGDANKFIKKLNDMEGGEAYRLPTEAEWEYAVRAGTTTEFSFGNDEHKLADYAWFDSNSGSKTHPVGTKEPNAWGLYDMHGNVLEVVEDDWHEDYNDAPDDGRAWIDEPRGWYRVIRGGSWFHGAQYCRSADRNVGSLGVRGGSVGFRLARSVALGP